MNPDKLFDYLDGKLSPADRAALEEQLTSDEQLRRQFNVAREIHRGGGISREVVQPPDDPERGARLSRRIGIAAIVLVFLNVAAGLTYIAFKGQPKPRGRVDPAVRQQVETSLDAAAKNAMPVPNFIPADIRITAPRGDWDNAAARIIYAAERFGGSGLTAPPDENMLTVVADVPTAREEEFRRAVEAIASGAAAPTLSPAPVASPGDGEKRTIVQVRIIDPAGQ